MSSVTKRGWGPQTGPFYWGVAALAVVGLGLASYLTYLHYSAAHTLLCDLGTGCDLVRASRYSTLLGVPVALFGALLYVCLILLALAPLADRWKRAALFGMATLGFVFSAHLTYAELFWIHAICPYCVASAIAMTAILVLLLARRPIVPGLAAGRLAFFGVGLAALTVVGVTFVPRELASSAGPSRRAPVTSTPTATPTTGPIATATLTPSMAAEPGGTVTPTTTRTPAPSPTPTPFPWAFQSQAELQEGLARHLRATNALLYYSPTCPHCADQKALFGDAVKYLDQVNCSGPEYQACMDRGISAVPTWEIGGRLYVGVKSLAELAALSGYRP